MTAESPLLDIIKTEITDEFDENIAGQLFDILEEEGFDDESIWFDVQNEDESSLKDQIPIKQFKSIQCICIKYYEPQQQSPKLSKPKCKSSKTSKAKAFKSDKTNTYSPSENKYNDITTLKRDYTDWDTKTKVTRNLYLSQCPGLVNNFPEKAFIDTATLGYDNDIPLILYIADTFNRFRINTFYHSKHKKDISISDFKNNLPFYKSMEASNNKGNAVHAILSSYHSRFVPKLQFDPKTKFNDKVEDIVKYIYAAAQMLDGILLEREQNKDDNDQHDIIPFQFDLVIIPKKISTDVNAQFDTVKVVDSDESDYVDTDSGEEPEEEEEESYVGHGMASFKDEIGFIEPRLRKYNIKAQIFDIEEKMLKNNASAQLKRKINENFKEVRKGRNGRYVMVVDRRDKNDIKHVINDKEEKKQDCDGKKTNNDKIYIYSPKCEQTAEDQDDIDTDIDYKFENYGCFDKLHSDFIEESLLFKTKKCLIPGLNDDLNDKHLGSDCKNLITLSFHVLSMDLIRCYLYVNGWGTRFEPIDLVKLLPSYFQKKAPKNSSLLDKNKLSALFPLKLKDEKFDVWYENTTKQFKKHSAK